MSRLRTRKWRKAYGVCFTGLGRLRPPARRYMHGACGLFAGEVMLATGWRMVRIYYPGLRFLHIACQHGNRLFDVRGWTSASDVARYFNVDRVTVHRVSAKMAHGYLRAFRQMYGVTESARAAIHARRVLRRHGAKFCRKSARWS